MKAGGLAYLQGTTDDLNLYGKLRKTIMQIVVAHHANTESYAPELNGLTMTARTRGAG